MEEFIAGTLAELPQPLSGWFWAVIFGRKDYLDRSLREVFRAIGWYHLVVVSGFHLGVFYRASYFFLSIPCRIFGVLCLINPVLVFRLDRWLDLCSVFLSFLYASCVGFSQPVQRAFITILVLRLADNFFGRVPKYVLLLFVIFVQITIFFDGFFSLANLLSWGAVCIVLVPARSVSESLVKQVYLSLLIGALIGELGVLWFFFSLLGSLFLYVSLGAVVLLFFLPVDSCIVFILNNALILLRDLEFFSGVMWPLGKSGKLFLLFFVFYRVLCLYRYKGV